MKKNFIYESVHDRERPLRSFYCADAKPEPHFHRCIEMLYITHGKMEGEVDGKQFIAEKDDIVFIRRCAIHAYTPTPHYGNVVLIVKSSYADDFTAILEKSTLPPLLCDKPYNRSILPEFIRLFRAQQNAEHFLIAKGLVNIIFGKLFSHYPCEPVSTAPNLSTILSVLNFIDRHYSEHISLDSLAAEFGYNKYYFSRLFNTYIGDSLNGYINMVRVNNVIALAKKRDSLNLSDLIYESGFDSLTTFYRHYARFYDAPPKAVIRSKF